MTPARLILTASCPDRTGIVAAVAGFIAEQGGWIVNTQHHAEADTGRYFMRVEIRADSLPFGISEWDARFAPIARRFAMDWSISDSRRRKRVLLLVSKQGHCLYDLLGRWHSGELPIDIVGVVSNHETFRALVEWHGLAFHHVPVTPDTRAAASEAIHQHYLAAGAELMVLARYMQILSPALCERLPGRIINIHHSFLPSFVGAHPHLQAWQQGVKLIGATCHYVTAELDAGPIIEQDTVRIDHADSVHDLARYGRDIEKAVLARGLRDHIEDRILLNGRRTVVFR